MRAAELVAAVRAGIDAAPARSVLAPQDAALARAAFSPPVQFSTGWTVLGILLLVAIVVYIVLVIVFTHVRRPRTQVQTMPSPWAVQETYLGLVDDVLVAHDSGVIGAREAHQRLSGIARDFATATRGMRAPYMTLGDLRRTRAVELADTIESLYPGEFGPTHPAYQASVHRTADRVRRLVSTW